VKEPVWIKKAALLLAQAEALIRHGGLSGLRDDGLLESALARPRNLYSYEGITDIRRLAVSYAAGTLRSHPFLDGNKRAAFIALNMFLNLNGFDLTAESEIAGDVFYAAAGELNEESLAAWVMKNLAESEK
jgi:death on curing protein